ncbi:MAG: cyclic nucleotide-binding domain-containing protein [Deltaproteobacteria bacterium]|nr:cyclic nucleotide-binding domain-containing protein [Deltaproteobacteria bacterium]
MPTRHDDPQGPKTSPRTRALTLDNLWHGVQDVVAGSHLFRSLSPEARKELVERANVQVFPAGRVILREREDGSDFYLVDQGWVEVTTSGPEDRAVTLCTLGRGGFFGEVSVLTGAPRTATVTALTDVVLVAFQKKDIDEVLTRDPKARRLLEAVVAGRARDALEKLARASSSPEEADEPAPPGEVRDPEGG